MPRLPEPFVPITVRFAMDGALPVPWREEARRRTLERVDDDDRRLEQAIDRLLDERRPGATICPSEAARAVDADDWRDLMPAARAAAGRLADAGAVEVTQGGEVVDVATARGPVRIHRRRSVISPPPRAPAAE
jgi:hypothetical protein